jgi:hypothetical protein
MTRPMSCDVAKQLGDDALGEVIRLDVAIDGQALKPRNEPPVAADDPPNQTLVGKVIQALAGAVALTARVD